MFPTQNQYFGWFPSLFMVLWPHSVFPSKSIFWMIPILFVIPSVVLLQSNSFFSFLVTSVVKFQGMVSKGFLPLFQSDSHKHDQGRSQTLNPGWAKEAHFLICPHSSIIFSHFASIFPDFLPQFGPPGGRFAHPGRPWLHH